MSDLGRNEGGGFLPAAPDIDDLMARITGGKDGWAGVNEGDAPPTDMTGKGKKLDDLRMNFVKTFSTPAGKKVLDHLLDISVRRGCAHPDPMAGIEQEALYSRERKGQNGIVCSILKLIVEGQGISDPAAKKQRKKK